MSLTFKLALSPLLVAQVLYARARLPRLGEPAGERRGVFGSRRTGTSLRLLIAGDSSAAGVGVADQRQALARQLAQRLAQGIAAQVKWRLVAQSGLTTAQIGPFLQDQLLDAAHGPGPTAADLAVVVSGVNDVIDQIPSHRAVAARETLANQLRNGIGVQHVVFAPLPPVHHFPGLPQPLRWVAGADAKRHNTALRRWCASRADVSCVDMEMPLNRGVMARDGFHPGEPVYRYCAGAIAQHITRFVWPLMDPHRGR